MYYKTTNCEACDEPRDTCIVRAMYPPARDPAEPQMWLYAAMRGSRPRSGVVGAVFQVTPPCSRSRSR